MISLKATQNKPLQKVRIDDGFWSDYQTKVRDTVIPYQWEALNDRIPGAEPSHAIKNFRITAGLETGEYGGMVFQDSDLAKWLEAVGYSLAVHPDPELEKLADEAIDLIVQAQGEDGYLNTYFALKEPGKRWTNLTECHELYCAGHMMEAAVAYYQGTGKRKLLDAMCRFADYIGEVFGAEEGKMHGYDGHEEVELALIKLYEATGEEKYLRLSQYFIDERGSKPSFFTEEWEKRGGISHWTQTKVPLDLAYYQAHRPVREHDKATGHAVRAVYLYTAMADLARLTGDEGLFAACRRLWNNITEKQMYITGGIGSTHHGEAFSFDYDLPNDTVYAETCASIGLIFFAKRMLELEADSKYADGMERALYNLVTASMSKDGKHYFYVNPLEVWPEASVKNPGRHHVKAERQKWFGCSCCPPNVARLLASLDQYIYTSTANSIYTHLYIGSDSHFELENGVVDLKQTSSFPWNGDVSFAIGLPSSTRFTLALRIPSWCDGLPQLAINGEVASLDSYKEQDGYLLIDRMWSDGDTINWSLPMKARWMEAHPEIRADAGKVALQRGPLVYCLEEVDNGAPIASLAVRVDESLQERFVPDLFGGAVVVEGQLFRVDSASWKQESTAYRPYQTASQKTAFRAVPYYLWGNRGLGEMAVWVRTK
ncbi:glycoside hydrolase family 127 protein [Gorillibacterium massiliense]|uniref:glycoside hydrolase family 127 protein n=1 Tax=Gorillibacterium massiliense TaxID=1280390 RepID=UPI0004B56B48|nr:beta-L-arabinofuranosidase domain-containing protein [Gorillibacterium massiliense]